MSRSGVRPKGNSHWSGGQWFAVPCEWLDEARMRQLSSPARLALLKLLRHANFETGLSRPSVAAIARAIYGASVTPARRRNAQKAVKELIEAGFCEVAQKGGGAGRATVYRMKNGGAPGDSTELEKGTSAGKNGVSGGRPFSARTVAQATEIGGPDDHETVSDPNTPTDTSTHSEATNAVADARMLMSDAPSAREALLAALAEHGLASAEYLLNELPPETDPADIRDAMKDVGPNARAGARVKHVRERIGQVLAARREREERKAERAAERAAWEQQAAEWLDRFEAHHVVISELEPSSASADLRLILAEARLSDPDRFVLERLLLEPRGSPLRRRAESSVALRSIDQHARAERRDRVSRQEQKRKAEQERKNSKEEAERAKRDWFHGLSDSELEELVERRARELGNPDALRRAHRTNPHSDLVYVELRRFAPRPVGDEADQGAEERCPDARTRGSLTSSGAGGELEMVHGR